MKHVISLCEYRAKRSQLSFLHDGILSSHLLKSQRFLSSSAEEALEIAMEWKSAFDKYYLLCDFESDFNDLNNHIRQGGITFMYPTLYRDFKNSTDSMSVLFQRTQEAIMLYDPNNKIHSWVLSLYSDYSWLDNLQEKLLDNISLMTNFINEYSHADYSEVKERIDSIRVLREKYRVYLEFFPTVNSWKLDNLHD